MITPVIKNIDRHKAEKYLSLLISSRYDSIVNDVKCMGGGSYGIAYKVNQNKEPYTLVVKIYRVDGMHIKDSHDLALLAGHCPIKIPQVYFTHTSDDNVPYDCIVMEYIPGKNALEKISLLFGCKKKRKDFARHIVQAMHELHSTTSDKFGDTLNPTFDNWLDYYKPFATQILSAAEKLSKEGSVINNKILSVMHAAYDKFDIIFSQKVTKAGLIHGDLNVMNIMMGKGYTINAIIDPLNAMYADTEYDLFQLNNLTGKRFYLYDTYKEMYPTSELCDAKCAFYGLYNEVYCYITSRTYAAFIMNPLIKNMKKQLALLGR